MTDQVPPPKQDRSVRHEPTAQRMADVRRALSRALSGFPEKLLQRDAAELTGDLRRKRALARELKELVGRLDTEDVRTALSRPLGGAYGDGVKRPLEGDGALEQDTGPKPSLDRDTLRNLARDMTEPLAETLAKAKSPLPYLAPKMLDEEKRRELLSTVMEGNARGLTSTKISKLLLERGLIDHLTIHDLVRGPTVLIGGRPYPASRYAETLARTTLYRASNRGALDRTAEAGAKTVYVPPSPGAVDFCLDLEGKVYALDAEAAAKWGVPLLADTPGGGPPWHPSCRHVVSGFVPRRSEAGKLPTPPKDVLTRDEGRDAVEAAQTAFRARLKRTPLRYADRIADTASLRGFGGRTLSTPGELRGWKVPGLVAQKKGREERFGRRALAEDINLDQALKSGWVSSRRELRRVAAETLRAAKPKLEDGLFVYRNDGWTVRVNPADGLVYGVDKG